MHRITVTRKEETTVWEMGMPPKIGITKYTYAPVTSILMLSLPF